MSAEQSNNKGLWEYFLETANIQAHNPLYGVLSVTLTAKVLKEGILRNPGGTLRTIKKEAVKCLEDYMDTIIDRLRQAGCKMVSEEDEERVRKAAEHGFYGTIYGRKYESGMGIHYWPPGDYIGRDGALWCVYAMPGPDYNRYAPEDYGITWALTEEELINGEASKA